MTTISALPPAPDINDPANFSTLANTFVAALPPMVTEINTVASEVNAANSNVNTKSAQVSTNASTVATNTAACAASAASAAASATLAQDWATKTSAPVSGSDYSSKYWAQIAQGATLGTLVDDTTSSTSKVYSSSKVTTLLSPINTKLQRVQHAEDFGAVGDGVTSDTASIAAGISAVTANPLILSKGPYNFTLTLPSGKGIISYTEGASKDVWYWGRNVTGAKAVGAGVANLGMGPAGFQFDLRSDTADCSSDFMRALYGRTVFGGVSAKGGRIGVLGETIHQLGATHALNANRNYVGSVGVSHSEAGDGGTDAATNSKGAYFGINGVARAAAGASNIFEVAGGELNTYMGAGSSSRYIFGASIAGFNAVHASELEAAIEIGGGTDAGYGPHVGWNNGILFSNIHGSDPTNSNTTLIGAYFQGGGGLRSIKAALDTSLFNCSSGIVLGPNLVVTDNMLSLGANASNVSEIRAGSNVAAANLDLMPKGGGAVRLYDTNSGVVRIAVDSTSGVRITPKASATPQNNGELVIQATSNTSLTFKFKGSDGVVRSASLALT